MMIKDGTVRKLVMQLECFFFFFVDLHYMKHNEQWVGSRRGIVSLQQQQDQHKGRGDNKKTL